MIESGYTTAVHKKLPPNVFHWKINDNFAGGVPDAYYVMEGRADARDLWVEYKFIKKLPARDSTLIKPDLSPQQIVWLERLVRAGKAVRIVVGVETVKVGQSCGGIVLQLHEAVNGVLRKDIEGKLLSYQGVADALVKIMEA